MKRTNLHLTDRQLDALRGLADRTGLSVAELVRRAVDEKLEREEQRPDPPADHFPLVGRKSDTLPRWHPRRASS